MAWAYAELAKEAAKRGGPTALRAFYTRRGIIIGGAITSASIAGTVAYDKWSKRRTAATAETASDATTETPPAGDTRSGQPADSSRTD
ncbi:hypothetical protein CUT44_19085 [Streptomyces carminius]|uniref:Uncharacterized protein n=1 Tax=Streptomyces carminius TaxID=2665496 RepID=A0A2M8LVE2_9ACTN|nr:hypothetical protein [Streptomyces carminius]PJE95920.1 hypothetical protein CUT44_19085 [Streptomyces carminius]